MHDKKKIPQPLLSDPGNIEIAPNESSSSAESASSWLQNISHSQRASYKDTWHKSHPASLPFSLLHQGFSKSAALGFWLCWQPSSCHWQSTTPCNSTPIPVPYLFLIPICKLNWKTTYVDLAVHSKCGRKKMFWRIVQFWFYINRWQAYLGWNLHQRSLQSLNDKFGAFERDKKVFVSWISLLHFKLCLLHRAFHFCKIGVHGCLRHRTRWCSIAGCLFILLSVILFSLLVDGTCHQLSRKNIFLGRFWSLRRLLACFRFWLYNGLWGNPLHWFLCCILWHLLPLPYWACEVIICIIRFRTKCPLSFVIKFWDGFLLDWDIIAVNSFTGLFFIWGNSRQCLWRCWFYLSPVTLIIKIRLIRISPLSISGSCHGCTKRGCNWWW